jgi:hypothetical protein
MIDGKEETTGEFILGAIAAGVVVIPLVLLFAWIITVVGGWIGLIE